MLRIDIPGRDPLELEHLVLDLNGTLCIDGALIEGVAARLNALSHTLKLHALTADTRGEASMLLAEHPLTVDVIPPGRQDEAKREFVQSLDASRCAAVGNGTIDRLMLADAALGVAVIQAEGACLDAMQAADVVCLGICDALDLLLKPERLVATLRV